MGYNHLTTAQAEELMGKYRADYFVTRMEHQLDLPIAYHNSLTFSIGRHIEVTMNKLSPTKVSRQLRIAF